MTDAKRTRAVAALLLLILLVVEKHRVQAQKYSREESESHIEEEDLRPEVQRMTPPEEFVEGEGEAESQQASEEEFPLRNPHTAVEIPAEDEDEEELLPSTSGSSVEEDNEEHSVEESSIVTSGPPVLPAPSQLPPREKVALSFVIAGVTAMDKDDGGQARLLFERAVEIAPLQPYSYFFLGRLALHRGEHQIALPLLRKADILLTRGDQAWRSEAMSTQGAVYEDLGEIPQARKAYRRSLQLSPQNLRAMSALARLAGEEAESDDAVSH